MTLVLISGIVAGLIAAIWVVAHPMAGSGARTVLLFAVAALLGVVSTLASVFIGLNYYGESYEEPSPPWLEVLRWAGLFVTLASVFALVASLAVVALRRTDRRHA
ncbi:MAG: hypothetical protein ABR583_01845 [Gaiellaceae bacterium]